LNNIPLIARAVEQSREILTKRLEEIDAVMSKSQEDAERFQRMMVREKLNPIGFNPVQFNKMRSDLEVEKIALKQSIRNLTGFEIVTNPIIFQEPVSPRPMLYLAIAGIFSLFGGLFMVLFMNFLEKVKGKKV
jgi:LPS O-antigen subunit length determinant protein (WzzB/FepE family)